MADIKTGPPVLLSRRGFLAAALAGSVALASGRTPIPKQEEQPYDEVKGLLTRALVRHRNLDTFIQMEEKLKDNSSNYHWVEWKKPDFESQFFKDLHMDSLIIKGDPFYLVISNPFESERNGEDVINVVDSVVIFPSEDKPVNPVPQSNLKLVAGGDQDDLEDFGIFPSKKEFALEAIKDLGLVNVSHIEVQRYKAELEHRLGMDLLNA